jgi:BASS family bile acid:Na+ symporter
MTIHGIVETYFIPTQLVLAMFGMGATLSAGDFVAVVRDVKGLVLGLVLQLVLVPLLALGFISAFHLEKGWAVGLLLVAVVPGGAFSNLLTYLGKGNTALSVALTTASNVTCVATIPLLLNLLVGEHVPPEFSLPTAHIVTDIVAYLLVPLAMGMVLLRVAPLVAPPCSRWAIRGSVVLLAFVVVSSLGSGRIDVVGHGLQPPLLIVLFGNLIWVVTAQLCRLLARFDDDNVAVTIEVSTRNVGLALLLVHFFFPGDPAQVHVLYTCLFYGGMSLVLGIPIALLARRGYGPAFFWPRRPRPAVASPV